MIITNTQTKTIEPWKCVPGDHVEFTMNHHTKQIHKGVIESREKKKARIRMATTDTTVTVQISCIKGVSKPMLRANGLKKKFRVLTHNPNKDKCASKREVTLNTPAGRFTFTKKVK